MYIKKQRLLTPGPTPLLPKALHAMMGSDIHHRTEDFKKLYLSVLADLKEVFGTSNDVLGLVCSGTGALEAAVTNFLSPGDRVVGGSQKAFMVPPGMAFISVSPKAWAAGESSKLPQLYFNLKKEKKNAANGEAGWTPNIALLLALSEALKYIKTVGMDKLIAN